MRRTQEMIDRVAATGATVIVSGETGVGKGIVAELLHARSPRRDRPFVKVNCAALPLELLENEMFGHERGAYTGADRRTEGKFQLADGGTLFLDEIAELPLPLQAKLLHVLQDHEFTPLGGRTPIRVDVRIVAATNRDLLELVRTRLFREDLYYRLNVIPIEVPPLRERVDEIPALIDHIMERVSADYDRPEVSISDSQLARLVAYAWPGNVRELENVVRRMVVLGSVDVVLRELPPPSGSVDRGVADDGVRPRLDGSRIRTEAGSVPMLAPGTGLKAMLRTAVQDTEAMVLRETLDRLRWRRAAAARELGISYKTLTQKMKLYGLRAIAVGTLTASLVTAICVG